MADAHAHEGQIIVNVFSVVTSRGSNGKYENAQFLKRGWMPLPCLAARMPIFIDDVQYSVVDIAYELSHREAMVFAIAADSNSIVKDAGKAYVPDVARYGASSH